jgi:DNA repair protein RadA/Sms
MAKAKSKFVCQSCGYQSPKYLGRCPNCGAWNSLSKKLKQRGQKCARDPDWGKTRPVKLGEVESLATPRVLTNMGEFNRVLGGGVVPGSLILIGGDPGIGKSTILLQVSVQLANIGRVLYVSGEESAQQIKMRAERLGDLDSDFYLYAENNMQNIRTEIEKLQPDFSY